MLLITFQFADNLMSVFYPGGNQDGSRGGGGSHCQSEGIHQTVLSLWPPIIGFFFFFLRPTKGGSRAPKDPPSYAPVTSYQQSTVNSRDSGHPRDRDLVSVVARLGNSGVRENFLFQTIFTKRGHMCVHFH